MFLCCRKPHWKHHKSVAGLADLAEWLRKLQLLWTSSWFGRLWVIQEAASASRLTFFHGQHTSNFTCIHSAARCMLELSRITGFGRNLKIGKNNHFRAVWTLALISTLRHDSSRSIIKPQQTLRASTSQPSSPESVLQRLMGGNLLHNLISCAGLGASNPHDVVYAIRSVSHITELSTFKPEYELSLTELWQRVARHVSEHRAEVLLSLAGARSPQTDRKLPSWTPDFSVLDDTSRERYTALRLTCRRKWKTRCGGIAFTEELPWSSLNLHPTEPAILRTKALFLFSIDSCGRGGPDVHFPVEQGVWHTMYFTLAFPQMLVQVSGSNTLPESLSVGAVPEASRSGDTVWLIQGCPLPFVLRLWKDGRYLLIGEVYHWKAQLKRIPWPANAEDPLTDVELA